MRAISEVPSNIIKFIVHICFYFTYAQKIKSDSNFKSDRIAQTYFKTKIKRFSITSRGESEKKLTYTHLQL